MKQALPKALYIDALSLVPYKKSGVGQTIEQTLRQLVAIPEVKDNWTIYLVVPLGKSADIQHYTNINVRIKTIPLPARFIALLNRFNLLPPIDWFIGRGIYIFPNYRNWPVWHSRSLTYIYDIGFRIYPQTVQPKNLKYLEKGIGRWIKRTDRVLTITEQVKTEIEKHLNVIYLKVGVVYCGVDTDIFYRRPTKEIQAVRKKYGITFEKYLLFIGNIEPRKNLELLLTSYLALPKKIQSTYGLVIIGGDGWLNEEFVRRFDEAQRQGANIFRPAQYVLNDDLPAIYSGATALVHPAIYEGFGIPPLEAMACEVPIVVSDIPSIREVVQGGGIYFDPYDAAGLTQAIVDVITQTPDASKLQMNLQRAQELSWRVSASMLLENIEAVYQASPKRPLIQLLKNSYLSTDRLIRQVCGDRPREPYKPIAATNLQQLRSIVFHDFLHEQPSYLQYATLRSYLRLKHFAAQIVKCGFRIVKALR